MIQRYQYRSLTSKRYSLQLPKQRYVGICFHSNTLCNLSSSLAPASCIFIRAKVFWHRARTVLRPLQGVDEKTTKWSFQFGDCAPIPRRSASAYRSFDLVVNLTAWDPLLANLPLQDLRSTANGIETKLLYSPFGGGSAMSTAQKTSIHVTVRIILPNYCVVHPCIGL